MSITINDGYEFVGWENGGITVFNQPQGFTVRMDADKLYTAKFTAINGDDKPTPTEAGKKKAQELCDCFKKPSEEEGIACKDDLNEKYLKYEDNADFEAAFHSERENCDTEAPDWW